MLTRDAAAADTCRFDVIKSNSVISSGP